MQQPPPPPSPCPPPATAGQAEQPAAPGKRQPAEAPRIANGCKIKPCVFCQACCSCSRHPHFASSPKERVFLPPLPNKTHRHFAPLFEPSLPTPGPRLSRRGCSPDTAQQPQHVSCCFAASSPLQRTALSPAGTGAVRDTCSQWWWLGVCTSKG